MSAPTARESLPDRLRGVALLGIVVVNAPFLGISSDGWTQSSVDGLPNQLTALLVVALAQGKFYLLFAFLFGYSSSFILRDDSTPNRRRFRRRLLALALIGAAHAVFFFVGDILITYALLGLALMAVSRSSDRALRRWTVASLAVALVVIGGVSALIAAFPDSESDSGLSALDSALATGSFAEASLARLEALPLAFLVILLIQGPMAFMAFTLGLRASRRRLLADPAAHRDLWRRMAILGLAIGLPLQTAAAVLQVGAIADGTPSSPTGALGLAIDLATAPVLTAGYIGLITLGMARWPSLLRAAAPAGRMSLTVYIGESAVLSLLFSGYGLGYFGQWGAFPVVLSGIAAWAVLSCFAWLWMRYFGRGPLETLLAWATGARTDSPAPPITAAPVP